MRKNPHVRICGGLGSATTLVYPTPLRRLEQDGTAIGTRLLLIERGDEGRGEQIREQNRLWYRVRRHAGVSVVAKTLCALRLYHTEAPVSSPQPHLHA